MSTTEAVASEEFPEMSSDEFESRANDFVDAMTDDANRGEQSLAYFKTHDALKKAFRMSFYETMSKRYVISFPQSAPKLSIR